MEKKKKRKHKNKNKSKNVPVIDDMHQWEEDRRRRGNQADSPSKVVKEIFHPVMFRYHPVEIVPCSTNGVIITRH